jgi:chitinase
MTRCLIAVLLLCWCGIVHAQATPALIGYYAGDGGDVRARDLTRLTHVIHCFQLLQGDSLAPMDRDQEKVLRRLVGFKRMKPELKVLLSFGGWGNCATCSEVFGREEGRRRFARSVHALLKRTWTDGIDLDWEYPAVQGPPGHAFAPADRHNFTLLVRALREELGTTYEISFAAGGTEECLLKGYEWDSIMPLVDRVHIMSYDLVHGYSTTTGHHTPLYSSKQQQASLDQAVFLLRKAGVPPGKIVAGAAFYARVFRTSTAASKGLYQPCTFSHTVPYSRLADTITKEKGWEWSLDPATQAPYAWNEGERLFLTCDDARSAEAKARYVRVQGLGGIMFWQLVDDRLKDGLMDVLHRELYKAP